MKTMYYHRKKFLFIPLIVAGIFLFSWVTMLLWNALIPEIFNLPVIGFWQAAGLLVLARLFFGSGHSGWKHNRSYVNPEIRSKIKNMSPEEKREFFRKMHYNHEAWHRENCNEKENEHAEKDNE